MLLDRTVREHRARLVGALVRWCGDMQLAEDAFADATERALRAWVADTPRDPSAWLLTVARNRVRDIVGSAERTRTRALEADDPHPAAPPQRARDDDTLALMFACVHPALDRSVHAPLILQVVIGAHTDDIATAFAMPTATLAKRLVRAKQKLRANHASFEVPDHLETTRVAAVLDAIYAAYSIEWLRVAPPESIDLITDQAVHASQLLLQAMPAQREARGLSALLLYLHSRRAARIRNEQLIPIDEQDPRDWDRTLITRAEAQLRHGLDGRARAQKHPTAPGPYELQAAIQSAHSSRIDGNTTPWATIARLYDALVLTTASKGAAVARAVAIAQATEGTTGLQLLDVLVETDPTLANFQPYWAARGALLASSGASTEAAAALRRAIELCTHTPSRLHLARELARLREDSV